MKRRSLIILLLCTAAAYLSASPAVAQQKKTLQTITLNDGTQLKGHLVDVIDGTYIIQTKHLGQVEIKFSDLKSLTTAGNSQPQLQQNQMLPNLQQGNLLGGMGMMGQINQLSQGLLADPEISSSIQELMSDPEIMNLMQDEKLLQEMMTMNPATIQNNQSLQQLMKHPKMQAIINKINGKMQNQPLTPTGVSPFLSE